MAIITQKIAFRMDFEKIARLKIIQVAFSPRLKFVFRADLNTHAANASSADILEMLFHIL